MFLLLEHLLLIVFLLSQHSVFLLKPALCNLNACLQVFSTLELFLLISLLIFLFFDQIKLSLDCALPGLLFSRCQGLKLMSISEWVPFACVSIQDVVHLVKGLVHGIVLVTVPLITSVLFIFSCHDFRLGEHRLDNLQSHHELVDVHLQSLAEKLRQVLVLTML